ncbi:alanine--tRNA ligase [Actinopolymorpha pittospori]|uniref:Alanine--tRNA ligase n=1 Tax=Actinopolymorpha pittospori TaxID=648752 RepID=A0A927N4W3_9ACTN|nr:alanyl-tRNA synthetase [Actinopolymorpha pittospori]
MRSVDIRRTFLDFFRQHGHLVVPSSSLIPDDATMLLTTAGMVQFKPYFLGTSAPPRARLTSAQKCVRTGDIESVGRTDRHTTFFEMLGNFSFGDYGPSEVVPWAYELLTEHLGMDPDRLWATVYRDDDETPALWQELGIPAERIQRLGMADNFWSTRGPGPCGPCSEIFYDRGPEFGREGGPAIDTDRYLEVWNLVFMRHIRGAGPELEDYPLIGDLPQSCVESGLGVERAAVVLQDVPHIHRTDALLPVLERLARHVGLDGPDELDGADRELSARVVVDHVRAAAFLLADGVLPAHDGRGYVLRRLIRRAVRHTRLLGATEPVLADLGGDVIDSHEEAWPELTGQRDLVRQALAHEEDAFDRTLAQGTRLLDTAIRRTRERREPTLSGRTAFELHDTYGFPVDLTVEVAQEAGLDVDTERFATLMDAQRRRAQRARAPREADSGRDDTYRRLVTRHGPTSFVGYAHSTAEGTVLGLVRDGLEVVSASEGERVELLLDRTPMYAESGGQVGDTGIVRTASGAEVRVLDTQRGGDGLHVHAVEVTRGAIGVGELVQSVVDQDRREATARSHSSTHVLHAVLRSTLGDHARQQGSLVAPGRLRFDFAHFGALDSEVLARIQEDVNQRLLADPEVRVWEASRAEAQTAGAIALFGETYGEVVRVVDIGDFSRELCGGTHVAHGSSAGPVRIVAEGSVGSGVRRIEALTGLDALRYADHERRLLEQVEALLGDSPTDQVLDRLRNRLGALADAERELAESRRVELASWARELAGRRRDVPGGWLVAVRVDGSDGGGGGSERRRAGGAELRELVEAVLAAGPGERPGGVVLGRVHDGKAQLVLVVNEPLARTGVRARDLLTPAGRGIGGGAGGVGRLAHAGGRDAERLDAALALAAEELASSIADPRR